MEELFPYTPRKTKFDTLAATFVGSYAHVLLDELKTTVKEQADAQAFQHWMILGTRGMGKSHLITMLYHIVKKDPEHNAGWIPLLMNEEEQGVFSLPTLFVRIVTKLGDELDQTDPVSGGKINDFLAGLREKRYPPDRLLEDSKDFLKDFTASSGKRLLVLIENADDLFTKCVPNPNEQKKFRKILQHDNHILLIATSPTFFEGIRSRKGVLFDFFRTRRLELLSFEEAVTLLQKLAEVADDTSLREKFKTDDYRLHVLYHLTGGNPRILMFLYLAISGQEEFKSALTTFQSLIEKDLTNYYLSRMRDIPNQEQPVVIALAESSRNLTQKEIAERTFLPARSIGTFMVRLENSGLVKPVSAKKGKNTLYTLTDQMFRLWYQWRTSLRDKKIIEAIVEFLSIWYKRGELEEWAQLSGVYATYALEALKFRETDRFKGYAEIIKTEEKDAISHFLAEKNFQAALNTMEFLQEYEMGTGEIEPLLLKTVEKCESSEDAEQCLCVLEKHTNVKGDTWFRAGNALLGKKMYLQSEKAFKMAIKQEENNSKYWRNCGMACLMQNDEAKAEVALTKAVELNPKDPESWKFLGLARGKQGNYAGAEVALTKTVELDPKDGESWKLLGIFCMSQKKYTSAEAALAKAIELNKDDAKSWKILGQGRYNQGNYVSAENALIKAVELDKKDAESWKVLGLTRYKQNKHATAEKAFSQAVNFNPDDAISWRYLGDINFFQGDLSNAEKALTQALKINPKDVISWLFLALVRLFQGIFASLDGLAIDPKKKESLTSFIANSHGLSPEARKLKFKNILVNIQPPLSEGWVTNLTKNLDGVEAAFTKAVELNPKDAEYWRILGAVRLMQARFASAEEAFSRAVEINPKDAKSWRDLGSVYHHHGKYIEAEEAIRKALSLEPGNISDMKTLSEIYFKNYSFDQCLDISRVGLETSINAYSFMSALGKIELRTKNVPGLLELFEKCLRSENVIDESRIYLHFYRSMIFLNRKDRTPMKEDLRLGVNLLNKLPEEPRRAAQGKLLDFLVNVIYEDNRDEIKSYIEVLKEVAPEIDRVIFPLAHVFEYFDTYAAALGKGKKPDREKAVKRAQAVLDRVPTELRDPVEKMIGTVKENNKWWSKRPKHLR